MLEVAVFDIEKNNFCALYSLNMYYNYVIKTGDTKLHSNQWYILNRCDRTQPTLPISVMLGASSSS